MQDGLKRSGMTKAAGGRARGDGFFTAEETLLYEPTSHLIGQFTEDSCAAACCRMILLGQGLDIVESYLRHVLEVDGGVALSALPPVLQQLGAAESYIYRADLSLETLRDLTRKAAAIVYVKRERARDGHALLVDGIDDEGFVLIRDPLPLGTGSAYKVSVESFLKVWLRRQERGIAIVVE